jgi:hypothetical protein
MCRDRSTHMCTDGISLFVCFNVKSFIPCQWVVDAIRVSFEPMEAECNPLAPSRNEILNIHNEVPVTVCVMEYTLGFWSSCCGHCCNDVHLTKSEKEQY